MSDGASEHSVPRGRVELRHLRAFVAVAEELSFSRAARRLHLVQQSLSSQIRQLEDELGTQLLRRTTRTVELTTAGEVFLTHARSILEAVGAAIAQTRRSAVGETGRLTICYTPTLAAETLPRLVTRLHERCPEMTLQLCEMWQAESVDAVRTGRFQVGMARCPDVVNDIEYLRLRDEPLGVVVSAHHRLATLGQIGMSDLADAALAIWPRSLSPGFYDLTVDFFRAHGFTGPVQEFEYLTSGVFHSDPAARTEVFEGRAFSVAFATQFDPVPEGFVWRPVDPAPMIPVHLFWRTRTDAVTRAFLTVAQEVAQRAGWLAGAHVQVAPR
ncbi:LysR substrate-binding domain-containing protein [Pseudonocardia parietis]|uniref:DNA-binding transcriptional LysR family regulator n=1 Tax=Pseudonocardia parietis TaxID=570936 RepID=A0ABS4VUH8_9PSEU|nr:LysR substrate-binding domain-containing protein [Pseudonocardia parietis]MBP2367576.1 DNA-binding transcriptional LysR family regulator [Pseudonocardia parietis]